MRLLRRKLFEYGVSLAALAFALLLRSSFTPMFGSRIPFATVMAAVAVAVGVGGLFPAVLVTVLGYLAARWLFVEPTGSLALTNAGDWIILVGYVFATTVVITFGLLMRRANRRYRALAAELAARNKQKDELLATVTHELRGPLAPIRGAVELMRTESAAPAKRQAQDILERQLRQLSRLIDDLSDAGQLHRRQLELHPAPVWLHEVVDAAVETVRPILAAKHQPLTVRLLEEPVLLDADAARLEQVFVNLLTNASKFTPRHRRVEIVARLVDRQAEISVSDEGQGIAGDVLPHVFELFYRGDRGQRGLGIGLALVRQLVTLHGGCVTARSDGPGRGSRFIVRLPVSPPAARAAAATSHDGVQAHRGAAVERIPRPLPVVSLA